LLKALQSEGAERPAHLVPYHRELKMTPTMGRLVSAAAVAAVLSMVTGAPPPLRFTTKAMALRGRHHQHRPAVRVRAIPHERLKQRRHDLRKGDR